MTRWTGSMLCGLLVLTLAVGCSSSNDKPETGASRDTTEADSTTTTTGLFGGGGTATTETTAANGSGGGGSGGGSGNGGGGGGGGSSDPTGSGSADPTSPVDAETPHDLSDAIGNDCADFADVGAGVQQPGTTAEGTCEFGGEIVNIYTFADVAAQRDFVENGSFFDCSFIVAFGGGGATYYVAGDGWIARPGTEAVARDLAAALDGEVASYTCEAG